MTEPIRASIETAWLLAPELALLLAVTLVLALGGRRWTLHVALAGLVAAAVAAVTLWDRHAIVLSVFTCDRFALTIKLVALAAAAIVALISHAQVGADSRPQGRFYALLLTATLALCLLAASIDLTALVVALHLFAVTAYVMTGALRTDERSTEAAFKFLLYGAGLSAVMLLGVSWLVGLTGSTGLAEIGQALLAADETTRRLVMPALVLLLAGCAVQVAAVPFHQWIPDAGEGAPAPVVAFLSVAPQTAGFALILRLTLQMFPADELALDWRTLLMALSAVSMMVGSLVALGQRNVKRLLAYSSVAQAGYLLIGVVAASPRGTTAVLFSLVAYVVANLGVWAVVVGFSNRTGSHAVDDYAGLSRRAPGLALVLLVCLLSLAGLPLTAGFIGRLYLFAAAVEDWALLWLAAVGGINVVILLAGYWRLIRAAYFAPSATDEPLPLSPLLGAVLGVLAIGVVLLGLFAAPLIELLQLAAAAL